MFEEEIVKPGPECDRHSCFACGPSGYCMVLTEARFGRRLCPFYKTKDTYNKDREAAARRLIRLGWYEKRAEAANVNTAEADS